MSEETLRNVISEAAKKDYVSFTEFLETVVEKKMIKGINKIKSNYKRNLFLEDNVEEGIAGLATAALAGYSLGSDSNKKTDEEEDEVDEVAGLIGKGASKVTKLIKKSTAVKAGAGATGAGAGAGYAAGKTKKK